MNLSRRTFLSGGCVLCSAGLLACTPTDGSGPVTGGMGAATDLSARNAPGMRTGGSAEIDDGLRATMDKAEARLRASRFLVREAKANAYVRGVVRSLAGGYADDIRTYIVRAPIFNATQAPNGMMQVYSGLLLRCTNEAQMAAVLGHELGHYLRAHSRIANENARQITDFQQMLAFLFAGLGMPQLNQTTDFFLVASFFAYGRDQEREADEIGIRLLAEHGLSPIEAARNWENVIAEDEATGVKGYRDALRSTHPDQPERAATLRRRASELPAGKTRSDDYREGVSALREMMFEDQIRTGMHAVTILIADRWLNEDSTDGLPLYAKGEALRLRAGDGDDAKSAEILAAAVADRRAPSVAWRSLGMIQRKLGRESETRESFREYLRLTPNAPDREFIRRSL